MLAHELKLEMEVRNDSRLVVSSCDISKAYLVDMVHFEVLEHEQQYS